MKRLILVSLFLTSIIPVQAQSTVDLEKEKAELLRLHTSRREAHFKTDADMLLENSSEETISVSRGKISRSKKSDAKRGFVEYFSGAKYQEWDDLEEPIVRISKDGSMAWMITRIRSTRTRKDSAGKESVEQFVYAGIALYEKQNGKWMRVANVSTFEPPN